MLNKIVALIMCAVIVTVTLCSCDRAVVSTNPDSNDGENEISPSSSVVINIGYAPEDSLNPFYMNTSLNSDLVSLVFEPLFYIDDTFCARNGIAKEYYVDGNKIVVTLDTQAVFSDGVQISSADVVYSFNCAKNSASYKNELSYISSATASAGDVVTFVSSAAVMNAVDSLNFPVVKNATAQDEKSIPLGTGLYGFHINGESVKLEYNPYCRKPTPNISTVMLSPVTQASTLIHTLELGTIDAYFDDFSSGSYSLANAASTKTNLSNLVFLGMNSYSYGLSAPEVRRAVYYAVNRQAIAKNCFNNYAVESAVPYHPEWHVIAESGCDISSYSLDYSKAKELLVAAGINDTVNYNLIVYSGNDFKVAAAKEIQSNLKNIGINVTVTELSWEDYSFTLANGGYDLYIGEVKLPVNMDMSALFGSSGVIKGVISTDTTSAAYEEFKAGRITLDAFTLSFMQNMPFAPICYRMGAIVYTDDVTPAADCDMNNAYKNIYEWKLAE